MDLNNMVNQALTNIHSEGLVEKIVRNKLEKTIESIIDDIFSSYGDFGKQLKEHVKQHFSINLGVLDLPSYNTLIAQVIKEKLDEITHIQGVEKLKEQMDRMLADVKPEYKLSELINSWKKVKTKMMNMMTVMSSPFILTRIIVRGFTLIQNRIRVSINANMECLFAMMVHYFA